ncbi:MAG: AraC family transcriptional regulator [Pseudomonadota bacterium]
MHVCWQPADADLRPFLTGMVERCDRVPAGLSLELPVGRPLLHVTLGADYGFAQDGGFERMPHLSLWGFDARTRVTRPEGCLHALVAVLTYRGAELLAPRIALSATGTRLDLLDRLGDNGARLLHRLKTARLFAERCAILQSYFRGLVRPGDVRPTGYVHEVADCMTSGRIPGSIAAIARHFAVNERTLRNHFRAELGVSPKRMLRVARLNRSMRALHPLAWGEGEEQDVRLEFFDDAHFHNEFRLLTGLTPRDFQRRKAASGDTLIYSLPGAP